jgi:S-disulfanyl-L-cysteine oxidoreductase SoxD
MSTSNGGFGFGQPASPDQIAGWDIDVAPDGAGLPPGSGSVAQGEALFARLGAKCHGAKGEGTDAAPALVGGQGTLATAQPVKTVGSYWPYATTLWDEINRAMPFNTPRVLRPDDVYAVTAYILYLNGIVTRDQQLNEKTLPKIVMPNRSGFILDTRPDIKSRR